MEELDRQARDEGRAAADGALDGPRQQRRRRARVLVVRAPGPAAVLRGDEAVVAVGEEERVGCAHIVRTGRSILDTLS